MMQGSLLFAGIAAGLVGGAHVKSAKAYDLSIAEASSAFYLGCVARELSMDDAELVFKRAGYTVTQESTLDRRIWVKPGTGAAAVIRSTQADGSAVQRCMVIANGSVVDELAQAFNNLLDKLGTTYIRSEHDGGHAFGLGGVEYTHLVGVELSPDKINTVIVHSPR